MSTLGTKLLKLRQEHKLSQTEIADILGVAQPSYNSWESDICSPRRENLVKISQYYKISLHELLDDSEKINISNHDITGGNILAKELTNNTIHFQQSPEIIELLKQEKENISKFIATQQELQTQTTKMMESHLKLLEIITQKN